MVARNHDDISVMDGEVACSLLVIPRDTNKLFTAWWKTRTLINQGRHLPEELLVSQEVVVNYGLPN